MPMNISIVIYKTNIAHLRRVVNCTIAESSIINKVYVIDNSPTNQIVETPFISKNVEYIFNNQNLGYGRAHNVALKKSIECNIGYHLVMNADVYFKTAILKKLLGFMDENKDVGIVMPKVLYPNGKVQYLCKLLPTPFNLFIRRFIPLRKVVDKIDTIYELRFTNYDRVINVPSLSGCFMLLRIAALKEVGLFDENYFMYLEDVDLCRRMGEKFKTIYYPLDTFIFHEYEKASYKNLKLLLVHMRSAIYYFNKWGWFNDCSRREINKTTLLKCGYAK